VARNPRALTDTFNELEVASTTIGLQINTSKTKYLICTPRKATLLEALAVKTHMFGRNDVFKYLGVLVTTDNVVTKEIQARLKAGNRCHYALQAVLKSRRISRKVKLNIYKTIIRPIVIYACETWVLTKKDELCLTHQHLMYINIKTHYMLRPLKGHHQVQE
jgi:hypothetical protein